MPGKLTYKHIAEHAGVSQMSVSNALRHPEQVRAKTLEKVEKAIEALGGELVRPDAPARNSPVQHRPYRRLRFITCAVPLAIREAPVYSRLFQSAIVEAGEQGYDLSFSNLERAEDLHQLNLQSGIDVLILMGDWRNLQKAPQRPALTLVNTLLRFPADHVGYNRTSVGRLVAQHFNTCKLKRVVYVGPEDDERLSSFCDAFDDTVQCDTQIVEGPYRISDGEQTINRKALSKVADTLAKHPPEGIFCHADQLAGALVSALETRLTKLPEIHWAGCNNDPQWCSFLGPKGITVDIGVKEIGALAVRRAVDISKNPGGIKQHLLVEPFLVQLTL